MKIINLTPHAVVINNETFPPSGTVARCQEVSAPFGDYGGVEIIRRRYEDVIDLPPHAGYEAVPYDETGMDERLATLYIVSALVRLALPKRDDLASPGDLVRDAEGKIIGAKNLVVN